MGFAPLFAPTSITMADAGSALSEGLDAIAQGATEIDLSRLTGFDSSAVSAVLAWQRVAAEQGAALRITGLPAGLRSLAQLYGVDALLAD